MDCLAHTWTCSGCSRQHIGIPALPPPDWEWHGSRLLCDDCSGNPSPNERNSEPPIADEVTLKPCPLCNDPMKVAGQVFGHTDSDAPCILARNAWSLEPRFINAWNSRVEQSRVDTSIMDVEEKIDGLEPLALEILFRLGSYDDYGYYNFAQLQEATGRSRNEVRAACQALAKVDLADYGAGLMTDEGEAAGSGYARFEDGNRLLNIYDALRSADKAAGGVA